MYRRLSSLRRSSLIKHSPVTPLTLPKAPCSPRSANHESLRRLDSLRYLVCDTEGYRRLSSLRLSYHTNLCGVTLRALPRVSCFPRSANNESLRRLDSLRYLVCDTEVYRRLSSLRLSYHTNLYGVTPHALPKVPCSPRSSNHEFLRRLDRLRYLVCDTEVYRRLSSLRSSSSREHSPVAMPRRPECFVSFDLRTTNLSAHYTVCGTAGLRR